MPDDAPVDPQLTAIRLAAFHVRAVADHMQPPFTIDLRQSVQQILDALLPLELHPSHVEEHALLARRWARDGLRLPLDRVEYREDPLRVDAPGGDLCLD